MYKIICLFFVTTQLSFSQIKKEYFQDFETLNHLHKYQSYDSIPFSYKITKDSLVNGFSCYKFEIKEVVEKINGFWIGVKNRKVYSFKKSDLNKPQEILQLDLLNKMKKGIFIYPFCKDYKIIISDIVKKDNNQVFFLEFIYKKKRFDGLIIKEAIFTIDEGFILIYLDKYGHTWS